MKTESAKGGVMNVVSGIDSGDRGICQNPELASSLEKTFAPASWPSTDGNGLYTHD